jgi:hypothetical protein
MSSAAEVVFRLADRAVSPALSTAETRWSQASSAIRWAFSARLVLPIPNIVTSWIDGSVTEGARLSAPANRLASARGTTGYGGAADAAVAGSDG